MNTQAHFKSPKQCSSEIFCLSSPLMNLCPQQHVKHQRDRQSITICVMKITRSLQTNILHQNMQRGGFAEMCSPQSLSGIHNTTTFKDSLCSVSKYCHHKPAAECSGCWMSNLKLSLIIFQCVSSINQLWTRPMQQSFPQKRHCPEL